MLAKQDFPDIEFQLYGKEAEIKNTSPMKTLRLLIPMKNC